MRVMNFAAGLMPPTRVCIIEFRHAKPRHETAHEYGTINVHQDSQLKDT